jgi:hypothetical protein
MDVDVLFGKKQAVVEKKITIFSTPIDDSVKNKLYSIANKVEPTVITIEEIKNAINE